MLDHVGFDRKFVGHVSFTLAKLVSGVFDLMGFRTKRIIIQIMMQNSETSGKRRGLNYDLIYSAWDRPYTGRGTNSPWIPWLGLELLSPTLRCAR